MFVRGQTAMSKPDSASARRAWVERKRPITEGRTVLPVIGRRTGAGGVRWLRVRLPGRPNNSTGWIRKARTTRSRTSWHLVVDLSERRVTVYRRGRVVRTFSAVIGTASTPTPRGKFFVEEQYGVETQYVISPRIGRTIAVSVPMGIPSEPSEPFHTSTMWPGWYVDWIVYAGVVLLAAGVIAAVRRWRRWRAPEPD